MTRTLFATRLYEAEIADATLLGELAHSIRTLAERRPGRTPLEPRASLCGLHQLRLAQRPAQARPRVRRAGEDPDAPRRQIRRRMRASGLLASRSSTACG